MLKKVWLCVCCTFLMGVSSAGAVPLNTQLVINGGAETGDTTGWTSTGIEAEAVFGPSVGFGAFAFTGGLGPETQTLFQAIDVSGNSGQINSGVTESVFGINLQSRSDSGFVDNARVDVSFLDGGGGVLNSFSFVDTINTALSDWNFFSDTRSLSVGTRSIEILLTADRTIGISSDGFFDDVSLQLNAPGPNPAPVPEPEPGMMLLMGGGLVGLMAWRRRRLRRS